MITIRETVNYLRHEKTMAQLQLIEHSLVTVGTGGFCNQKSSAALVAYLKQAQKLVI